MATTNKERRQLLEGFVTFINKGGKIAIDFKNSIDEYMSELGELQLTAGDQENASLFEMDFEHIVTYGKDGAVKTPCTFDAEVEYIIGNEREGVCLDITVLDYQTDKAFLIDVHSSVSLVKNRYKTKEEAVDMIKAILRARSNMSPSSRVVFGDKSTYLEQATIFKIPLEAIKIPKL